jgi:hypothetical protein
MSIRHKADKRATGSRLDADTTSASRSAQASVAGINASGILSRKGYQVDDTEAIVWNSFRGSQGSSRAS